MSKYSIRRGEGWEFARDTVFTRILSDLRSNKPRSPESKRAVAMAKRGENLSEAKLEEYERATLIDPLTKLFNPRTFIKKLQYEVKRAKRYKRPLSLLVMSVDGVGRLGQEYGAMVIDEILRSAAVIVQDAIRDVDIAARCGHDQLAVIFPETYSSRAIVVGERIKEKMSSQSINAELRNVRVTASIGVVSFPTHAREDSDLMSKALEFLETAQKRGGDCVYNG